MSVIQRVLLFFVTACAEILGCYLVDYWTKHDGAPRILLALAAASLALFALLLTLHPTAAGRTYAAYGGVYVVTALGWLWLVERQRPNHYDLIGSVIMLIGMAIIAFAPRGVTARGP